MVGLTLLTLALSIPSVQGSTACTCDLLHPYCLTSDKKCYAYSSVFGMPDDVSSTCTNCTGHFLGQYTSNPLNPNDVHHSHYACHTDGALWGGLSESAEQCKLWCDRDVRCHYYTVWTSASNWCRLSSSCDPPYDVRPDDELMKVYKKVENVIPGSDSWSIGGCQFSSLYHTCDGATLSALVTGSNYCCCNEGYNPSASDPYCIATTTTTTTTTTVAAISGSATWLSCDYDHMSSCFTHCCCDSWYEYDNTSETCVAATTSTTITTTQPPPDAIPLAVCNIWCVDNSHVCGFNWCCDVGYAYNEASQDCQKTTTTTTTEDLGFFDAATYRTLGLGFATIVGVMHLM